MRRQRALALAALAATAGAAGAQSSVQLYGVLDTMAYRKELAGEAATARIDSGGLTTSHWGMRGNEDLGGGLRALFDLSAFVRVDTGGAGRSDTDAFFARASWVGLQGGWGTVKAGRQTTPGMLNLMRYSAFNDSAAFGPSLLHNYMPSATQPLMTGSGATDSGWSNVVSYASPAFSGITATLYYAPSEGTAAGTRRAASLVYGGSAFSTGLVVERMHGMNLNFSRPPASIPMADADTVNWGASYDFGVAKAFGQAIRTRLRNATMDIELRSYNVGATVPAGPGRVLASYGWTLKEQTAAADAKRRTLSLGYDYDCSKRTDLYVVAMNDRATGFASGLGFALGLRHRF